MNQLGLLTIGQKCRSIEMHLCLNPPRLLLQLCHISMQIQSYRNFQKNWDLFDPR